MLARLHLVRHGEVSNPGGVVYADLPGFPLTERGRGQAAATADHLAGSGAAVLVTSPLDRAVETASFISRRLGLDITRDARLTEWGLSTRWAGERWDGLDDRFPGELAAYFADPSRLPFVPETLEEVARRTTAAVAALGAGHPGAVAIAVSHQDPIHALRRALTGTGFDHFHVGKPVHAEVITLEPTAMGWTEVARWAPPEQGPPFPPPVER